MKRDLAPGVWLRHATPQDHPALCRVSLLTGNDGADASGFPGDPDLLGMIFSVPYQVAAPDFAFVIEDAAGVGGYVLAAADTAGFDRFMRQVWLPRLAATVADPGPDPALWQGHDWARHMVHHPRPPAPVDLGLYPAHGHIDLLPRLQGRGLGRLAMLAQMEALARAGARGLHLPVSPRNDRALAFYAALGFHRLDPPGVVDDTLYVARRLVVDG